MNLIYLLANLRLFNDSVYEAVIGEIVVIIVVLQFPPKESKQYYDLLHAYIPLLIKPCNILVSFESR